MFYFINSLRNILRNKGKYIIVAILIFIISFISTIALIINQSSDSLMESYMKKYGATATIEFNPQKMQENFKNGNAISNLTYEDYQKYANSKYVNSVSYTQTVNITSDNINQETNMPQNNKSEFNSSSNSSKSSRFNSLSLVGSEDIAAIDNFKNSVYVLVDGNYPTNANEILLNSQTAKENSLKVGNSITVKTENSKTGKMKIVGLYSSSESNQQSPFSGKTIYTTYDTVSTLDSEKSMINASYKLTSYKVVAKFQKELYSKGLSKSMYVNNNKQTLNQITGPLESMKSISNNFMILIIILGAGILIFINILILRDRKYEIGVMRALGQTKLKIIGMLLIELLTVLILTLCISIFTSTLSAQSISNTVFNTIQTTSSTSTSSNGNHMGGPQMGGKSGTSDMPQMPNQSGNKNTNIINNFKTIINYSVYLEIAGIWLIIIFLTTLVSIFFINKQQPNEILRKRG